MKKWKFENMLLEVFLSGTGVLRAVGILVGISPSDGLQDRLAPISLVRIVFNVGGVCIKFTTQRCIPGISTGRPR